MHLCIRAQIPGAAAAIARLQGAGCKVVVVSSQACVGKGFVRTSDVNAVMDRMCRLLRQVLLVVILLVVVAVRVRLAGCLCLSVSVSLCVCVLLRLCPSVPVSVPCRACQAQRDAGNHRHLHLCSKQPSYFAGVITYDRRLAIGWLLLLEEEEWAVQGIAAGRVGGGQGRATRVRQAVKQ